MPNYLHHNNIDALLWLQSSAEQKTSYMQAYRLAKTRVAEAMAGADPAQTYCITSDLDETLFDNSAYNEWLVTTGQNFDEAGSWDRFCRAQVSLAMPGVLDFYAWLTTTYPQVRVFYVTSRVDALRLDTAANLAKFAGVPTAGCTSDDPTTTRLFMKNFPVTLPDGTQGTDKYTQYRYIEEVLGYTTLIRLGDNASDFHADFGNGVLPEQRRKNVLVHAAEWGVRWIQMPNPVYGSFLISMKNADGSAPIIEDEGSGKPGSAGVVREPRTLAATPKVRYLDPWSG